MSPDRGRPPDPVLDDRTWQELVDQTTALIEHYAPQWTDRSASDLGVTLVELFAWLVEGLTYRLNRVPEKNYLAFLNLLGILREPATPARTLLTFRPLPGRAATVPTGTLAQTTGSESVAPVVFQTESTLSLVPATPRIALSRVNAPSYVDVTDALLSAQGTGASLDLAALDNGLLIVGLDKDFTGPANEITMYVELGALSEGASPQSEWAYSSGALDPTQWPRMTVVEDTTRGLTYAGVVRLRPGAAPWSTQDTTTWSPHPPGQPVPRLWVALRLANGPARPGLGRLRATVRQLLPNTVGASTALTAGGVAPENLGTASGAAQTFELRNRPVYAAPPPGPPYRHVRVTVSGAEWTMADSAATGPGRFYRLSPVTGEIIFGASPDWELPAVGAAVAATYRYVATSAAGNVPRDAIGTLAAGVPDVIAVTNPVPATGGTDEEPIEETKARAPMLLRTRDRAVTAEDYELLARQAASDLAVVRCLPPQVKADHTPWAYGGLLRAPGNVNVIIVPDFGADEPRPAPTLTHVHQVYAALDARRDVTALLRVTGPRYLPINVRAELVVFQRAVDQGLVSGAAAEAAALADRVRRFLHPVHGGPAGTGWQVGQSVYLADVYRAVKPDDRIGYLADLGLVPAVPLYHDPAQTWSDGERPFPLPTAFASHVRLADFELVCFGKADVPPPELE